MYKFTVIDLFCGCGGLSEGFKQAGFKIVGGIDFNNAAIETYNTNFEGVGRCIDLTQISEEHILSFGKEFIGADVIIGGPPCQGFSSANRYKKEEEDLRNKLFYEFVKFVDIIKPKFVVIENVRGIVTRDNGYAKDRIYEIFEERGYIVNHSLLDSSDFGVPQKRIRNFFVMSKNKKFDFEKLKKKQGVTVKEAISELYDFDNCKVEDIYVLETPSKTTYQKYLRKKDNKIYNHLIKYPAEIVQKRIACVPQGGNWMDIPKNLFDNNRTNRHSSAYKRLDENNFSVTIDTGNSHSNYFHPIYNRIPTVREAARLQSFKDSFIFEGSRTEQYRQVGNAVPPLLAKNIATQIKKELGANEK